MRRLRDLFLGIFVIIGGVTLAPVVAEGFGEIITFVYCLSVSGAAALSFIMAFVSEKTSHSN